MLFFAQKFKSNGFFIRQEAEFLQERLCLHSIDFPDNFLPVKLLSVELVPSTCWFSNVRDHVPKKTWDSLRKSTYKKANYHCEICGGRGNKWPVECHEIWHYDDINHLQTLLGLTSLCPSCHRVKHIGLAGLQGHADEAEAHLTKVNGWNSDETDNYLESVWNTWEERSSHQWTFDLSHLLAYGIQINSKR